MLVTLLAITITAALLLATTLRTTQDTTVTHTETLTYLALTTAQSALCQALTTTDVPTLQSEPIGTTTTSTATTPTTTTHLWITRTDTTLVWLTASADIHQGVASAHHQIALSAAIVSTPSGPTLHPLPGRAWVELSQ